MKMVSTVLYYARENQRSHIHQSLPSGSMLCICAKAAWRASRPTGQDLRQYAAGGASAIST
jgi:hypothetical protein